MNSNHTRLCGSPEWAAHIQDKILPTVTAGVDLGADMLEIGPGPGAASEWLRHRVRRLAVLEADEAAAAALAERFRGGNVEVAAGDATRLSYPGESFDSVGSFTMLHHVPAAALQHQVLGEAFRVLRPGGVLIGSDSLPSNELHHFHERDTWLPVEPATLLVWLRTLGFAAVTIIVDSGLMFTARKGRQDAGAQPGQGEPQACRKRVAPLPDGAGSAPAGRRGPPSGRAAQAGEFRRPGLPLSGAARWRLSRLPGPVAGA